VPGPPLVTIGIPTYNRAEGLQRAVRSALAQDHAELEIVVSDDASTDSTEAVMRRLADQAPRLRYVRQQRNLGHAGNFQALLDAARGEYFMWLSDDDWIDPSYVSSCLAVLSGEPGYSLVGGLARYYSGGREIVDERPTDLVSARPAARVLRYLARVNVNGVLFGVARRAHLRELSFREQVGGDWLLVAGLAAAGRVRTLPDVHIHRSLEGLSSDREKLGESFGMRGPLARHHHFAVAASFAREIVTAPAYGGLSRPQRAVLATLAAALIVVRFPGGLALRRLLRRLGLERLEAAAIARARSRD
jgi:glycosyltransferase involved in cell wall biosynthesis